MRSRGRGWSPRITAAIPNPIYVEFVCAEGNAHVKLGEESYMISADGYLMPAKKGQKPPDMRYFNRPSK